MESISKSSTYQFIYLRKINLLMTTYITSLVTSNFQLKDNKHLSPSWAYTVVLNFYQHVHLNLFTWKLWTTQTAGPCWFSRSGNGWCKFASLTSAQVVPMLQIQGPHFVNLWSTCQTGTGWLYPFPNYRGAKTSTKALFLMALWKMIQRHGFKQRSNFLPHCLCSESNLD